jgi:tetratricopeptide (TPR) repeat protein
MTVKDLHHLAIYTNSVFRGPSNKTDIYMHLVRSMLSRASALGHEPSTLTAINLSMTMENQLLDVTDNPRSVTAYTDLPDEVHERFAAIVELGDVPDALVLSGRIALNRGDPVRAAEMFRKAEAVGKEQKAAGGNGNSGSYELRGMCLADLGTALMKLGDEEAAMKCFVEAAGKYNMASAWQQLAYGGHCDKGVMTWTQDLLRGSELKTAWRRVIEGYDNMAANALERGDKDMFMDCQILASEFRKASKAETVGEE